MEPYKIAANAGVKSMQKLWLIKELEEHSKERRGTVASALEHLDVLGLIAIFKIDLTFLNPPELMRVYEPGMHTVKLHCKDWMSKRQSKGYNSPLDEIELMKAQLLINSYVENNYRYYFPN
jgi:hypothetical protein